MISEAQRIAIAEACGWVFPPEFANATKQGYGFPAPGDQIQEVPDYLHSLDAMHEAEKVLDAERLLRYHENLWRVIPENDNSIRSHPIHATAAQRAEAFLHTIGKWTE